MIQAIPPFWKRALRNELLLDQFTPKFDDFNICSGKSIAKQVYQYLTDNDKAIISSGKVWSRLLGSNFDITAHRTAFRNIYLVTNVIKLRNFQFRLLHNKIFCNDVLFHWKIKVNQQCDFCSVEKQNIIHLIWDCPMAQKVWGYLKNIVEFKCENICNLEWTLSNVIFNSVHPKPSHIINFLVLICKFYIFKMKCSNGKIQKTRN